MLAGAVATQGHARASSSKRDRATGPVAVEIGRPPDLRGARPGRSTPRPIYDLASLTKVIATGTLAMRHAAAGTLPLETRVGSATSCRRSPAAGATR